MFKYPKFNYNRCIFFCTVNVICGIIIFITLQFCVLKTVGIYYFNVMLTFELPQETYIMYTCFLSDDSLPLYFLTTTHPLNCIWSTQIHNHIIFKYANKGPYTQHFSVQIVLIKLLCRYTCVPN